LALLDLGNLAAPKYLKAIEGPLTRKLVVSGSRAYGLSGGINVGSPISQDQYYSASESFSLDTYDLSFGDDFFLLNSSRHDQPYDFVSGRSRALVVKAGYVFVADSGGLKIIDLTDYTKTFAHPTSGYVHGLAIADNLLAAAEDNGLELFDIRYPTKPSFRGRLAIRTGPEYGFADVAIAGEHVLVVNTNTGLHVIDARTTNLLEVGRYAATGCDKVVLAGNYALVAQGSRA
jgi:hypothetical protein